MVIRCIINPRHIIGSYTTARIEPQAKKYHESKSNRLTLHVLIFFLIKTNFLVKEYNCKEDKNLKSPSTRRQLRIRSYWLKQF